MEFTLFIRNNQYKFTENDVLGFNGQRWFCETKSITNRYNTFDMPMPRIKCAQWVKEGVLVPVKPYANHYRFASIPDEALENQVSPIRLHKYTYSRGLGYNESVFEVVETANRYLILKGRYYEDRSMIKKKELDVIVTTKHNDAHRTTFYSLGPTSDAKTKLLNAYSDFIDSELQKLDELTRNYRDDLKVAEEKLQ